MIEPLFIRWRQIVRAAMGQGRAHGREPYGGPSRSDRPDAPGEPGSTPLGTDDEGGTPLRSRRRRRAARRAKGAGGLTGRGSRRRPRQTRIGITT